MSIVIPYNDQGFRSAFNFVSGSNEPKDFTMMPGETGPSNFVLSTSVPEQEYKFVARQDVPSHQTYRHTQLPLENHGAIPPFSNVGLDTTRHGVFKRPQYRPYGQNPRDPFITIPANAARGDVYWQRRTSQLRLAAYVNPSRYVRQPIAFHYPIRDTLYQRPSRNPCPSTYLTENQFAVPSSFYYINPTATEYVSLYGTYDYNILSGAFSYGVAVPSATEHQRFLASHSGIEPSNTQSLHQTNILQDVPFSQSQRLSFNTQKDSRAPEALSPSIWEFPYSPEFPEAQFPPPESLNKSFTNNSPASQRQKRSTT